jgi:hypothetical protein
VRRDRRLPLIRVALVSALVGHWIANAIADPGEYASVGLPYEGAALRPISIQTALVALAIVAITLAHRLGFRRRRARVDHPSTIALTLMLVALQTTLFAAMEITERLSIGEAYAAAFRGGILGRGFAVELVVAIATALLLVGIAIGVRRIVRAILMSPRTRPAVGPPVVASETTFVRPVLILAGSGGVRAPPVRAR